MKLVVMRLVDDCFAVVLTGEGSARSENRARFVRLGHPVGNGLADGTFGPVPGIQVQQDNLMAQIGVARYCSPTPVFRVTRMTARYDDFEFGVGALSPLVLRRKLFCC